jgi:hypothetical protein
MNKSPTLNDVSGNDSISIAEFNAFTGGGIYIREWQKYIQGSSRHAGWNGWAAVFGAQWFFYRKLYIQGVISAVIEQLMLASIFLFIDFWKSFLGIENTLLYLLSSCFFLIVRILIGYWGNIAYYKKAVSVIRKTDLLNLDNEAHLRVIKSEGGINFPAFLLAYAAYGAIIHFMK